MKRMNYCYNCGVKLKEYIEGKTNFCVKCGIKLADNSKNSAKKVQCTICHEYLDLEKERTIKCSFCESIFHYSCVANWLSKHNACPMCQNQFLIPKLDKASIIR